MPKKNDIFLYPRSIHQRMNRQIIPKHKQNIFGAILRSTKTNRYLLVLGREAMKWSFPKGHTNCKDESHFDCLTREVFEETGFIDLPRPIRCTHLRVGVYFEIDVEDEFEVNPIDIKEIVEGKWVTKEEAAKMTTNIDTTFFFRSLNKAAATAVPELPIIVLHDRSDNEENEILPAVEILDSDPK